MDDLKDKKEEIDLSHANLIQVYISDINNALKDQQNVDISLLFKELYEKEQEFAKLLQSTMHGRNIYRNFIRKIMDTKGGMKVAQPYFRVREENVKSTVNAAIRERKPELLFGVPINYRFCHFAMKQIDEKREDVIKSGRPYKDKGFSSLFNQIKNLRDEIVRKHLFLSLNRAKVFKQNSYGASTQFEDLIQLANEALVIAVDKYVMEGEDSSFHAMAIGRMLAHLIENGEDHSAATIGGHGKKKLYQIRKILQDTPDLSSAQIANIMQEAESEIVSLMGATAHQQSLDEYWSDDSKTRIVDTFSSEDFDKPGTEEKIEHLNFLSVLADSHDVLSVMEMKVLRLKGVRFNANN